MTKKKCAARKFRERKRKILEKKIKLYHSLNRIVKLYPKTIFERKYFALPDDPVPNGTRKQRNKISSLNSRTRLKRMVKELDERLATLQDSSITMPGPIYLADFEPIFQFNYTEVPLQYDMGMEAMS